MQIPLVLDGADWLLVGLHGNCRHLAMLSCSWGALRYLICLKVLLKIIQNIGSNWLKRLIHLHE